MLGDNMYGRQQPQDFVDEVRAAVRGAAVGRRRLLRVARQPRQPGDIAQYQGFNMGGERYYTFTRKNARFFVLDSNQMDPTAAGLDRQRAEAVAGARGRSATSTIRSIPTAAATDRT